MDETQCAPEDSDVLHAGVLSTSDDDRSVAADSWSIKSDYGSIVDDEQRHADARGFSPDKEELDDEMEAPDAGVEAPTMGLQSYWDVTYTNELANFLEHGHLNDIWLESEVMKVVVASWTRQLCMNISEGHAQDVGDDFSSKPGSREEVVKCLSNWSVLDIGTGNDLLLQELAKQGFSNLTGIDYSQAAIDLARNLAVRDKSTKICFLVDDVCETKLERQFQLVMDKGALDTIGLHPDGPVRRTMYWESLLKLVSPGGILVITSSNSTKDLVQEVEAFNRQHLLEPPRTQIYKESLPCSNISVMSKSILHPYMWGWRDLLFLLLHLSGAEMVIHHWRVNHYAFW